MLRRLKNTFAGLWMLPAGPEPHCGDDCMEAASRFGYEARRKLASISMDEEHLADAGEWDALREAELRRAWEAAYPRWEWSLVREHVWRAWAVAGTGDTFERSLH